MPKVQERMKLENCYQTTIYTYLRKETMKIEHEPKCNAYGGIDIRTP